MRGDGVNVSAVKRPGLQRGRSSQHPQLPAVPLQRQNPVSSLPFKVLGWGGLWTPSAQRVCSTPPGLLSAIISELIFPLEKENKSVFFTFWSCFGLDPLFGVQTCSPLLPPSLSLWLFLRGFGAVQTPLWSSSPPQHPSAMKGVSLPGRELQQLGRGAGGRPAKAGQWGAADAAAAAARCGPGHALPFPIPHDTPIRPAKYSRTSPPAFRTLFCCQ